MNNTIKVAKRTGKTKSGNTWEAYAVEIMDNGTKYSGLIFQPRNPEISDRDNVISNFIVK
jgi:hypothetical protein